MPDAAIAATPRYLESFNQEGRASVLVLCDHAGREVPPELDQLGLGEETLARHIGWDIGAADVARRLASLLDAPALLNHCCRLVIDCNRRPYTPTSIPPISDGCVVPGNIDLPEGEARRRAQAYFLPYHRAIARAIARFRRAGRVPAVIAVHSFTPRMHGENRPWQVGVLWRNDRRLSAPILSALRQRGNIVVGDNQPYSGIDEFGFTIEFHAQRARLPHLMFELRQDEIDTPAKAEAWATLLAAVLREPLADPMLYRPWEGPLVEGQPWRSPRGLIALR